MQICKVELWRVWYYEPFAFKCSVRKQSFVEDFVSVWIAFIYPTFKSAFTPRLQCMLLILVSVAFGYFLGPMALFMGPRNLAKCAYPWACFPNFIILDKYSFCRASTLNLARYSFCRGFYRALMNNTSSFVSWTNLHGINTWLEQHVSWSLKPSKIYPVSF